MKFNRRAIMKTAWAKYRSYNLTFAQALRMAWYDARKAMPVHQVWADAFHLAAPVMLADSLTFEAACRMAQDHKYRFDSVTVRAA